MRKVLLYIVIVLCVIVGLGSLAQCTHGAEEPSASNSSSSSSSSGGGVTQIELSDDELIF